MAKEYKVGDKVKVKGTGEEAEVVQVVHHQRLANNELGTLYGVKLCSWKKKVLFKDGQGQEVCRFEHPDGEKDADGNVLIRDHEADTIGCLHADDLEAGATEKHAPVEEEEETRH